MSKVKDQDTNKLLSLKLDAVLKLYFSRKENEEQLRQFLKAVIPLNDDSFEILVITNPILTKQHVHEKDFIVDIHLTSATGELIIIEMQAQNHSGFIDRMVSYNARDFASQLEPGENYSQLKSAISVVVVDFNMFKDTEEFCEHILLRRENNKIFTKAQQFYIIDVTKTPNEITNPLHMWGKLFKVETKEELRMLMNESDDMREAGEKLLKLSADREAQEIAEARRLAIWERNHMITSTRDEERKIADIRVKEVRDKADEQLKKVDEQLQKADAQLQKAENDNAKLLERIRELESNKS